MSRYVMAEILEEAKQALSIAGLLTGKIMPDGDYMVDESSKNLIGQLILANAIEGRPK